MTQSARNILTLALIALCVVVYVISQQIGHDAQNLQQGIQTTQKAFQQAQPQINQAEQQLQQAEQQAQQQLQALTNTTGKP